MNFRRLVFIILLPFLFAACVNTRAVSEFSITSQQSLSLFETLPYNFTRNCNENCALERIKNLDFNQDNCDCSLSATADSVTLLIYTQLDNYLAGLAAFSDKRLARYNTAGIATGLTEGAYGNIRIGPAEAGAFSDLTSFMLNTVAGKYRRNKLKEFVTKGNRPFQQLIQYLQFNLSQNLSGLLENQKLQYRSSYFSLIRDTSLSGYERRKVMEDYHKHLAEINNHLQAIEVYSRSLETIATSHQYLYDHIDRLSDDDFLMGLSSSAVEMKGLISRFKILNQRL